MEARIAPSAKIEEAIEEVLLGGLDDADRLSELGRLGARLVLQRAVEEEVTAFLGRTRYERTPEARGSRNGTRPRRVQTAEGEISIAVPQVRGSLTRFVSATIPDTRAIVRTRPLEALVIGAYVRGLSDRDIESLAAEAGLGTISKTTVSSICRELRDRYRAFRARSLAEVRLLALMLDAIYLPVRPEGPKEGVLVAWGFTTEGQRLLLDVSLGQRERLEDWLDLGRGLSARGLRSPLLVVSDGAPGLIRAIGELWPDADRRSACIDCGMSSPSYPSGPGSTSGCGRPLGGPRWGLIPSRGRDGAAGPRGRAVGRVPLGRGLPGRGPASPHRPSRLSASAPQAAAVDQPAGTIARGSTQADQGHRPLPR